MALSASGLQSPYLCCEGAWRQPLPLLPNPRQLRRSLQVTGGTLWTPCTSWGNSLPSLVQALLTGLTPPPAEKEHVTRPGQSQHLLPLASDCLMAQNVTQSGPMGVSHGTSVVRNYGKEKCCSAGRTVLFSWKLEGWVSGQ